VYGTNFAGGQFLEGTVYRMSPDGVVEVLHNFPDAAGDGQSPFGRLVQASDGNLYGTTERGGAFSLNDGGMIYRISLEGTLTVLHSFGAVGDTSGPFAGLTQASDGKLYGVTCTSLGGSAVYSITLDGNYQILYQFRKPADGDCPHGELIEGTDGLLYGTTLGGGQFGGGTVYSVSKSGHHTVLHSFSNDVDGSEVQSALVQASDGLFYGTTEFGGANGQGTVFRMDAAGNLTTLHNFPDGSDDGRQPFPGLVQGGDGFLYGTTEFGGGSPPDCNIGGCGIVFRMALDGTMSTVHTFGTNFMGQNPVTQLSRASNHRIMGASKRRDAKVQGTLFIFREQRP
jgi:uncharacterized repeat protein (TIGR03803 family)